MSRRIDRRGPLESHPSHGTMISSATFSAYARARISLMQELTIYRAFDGDLSFWGAAVYARVLKEAKTGVRMCL